MDPTAFRTNCSQIMIGNEMISIKGIYAVSESMSFERNFALNVFTEQNCCEEDSKNKFTAFLYYP